MNIATYQPERLPLKHIDLHSLLPTLTRAYAALGQFQALLTMAPKTKQLLFLLRLHEARAAMRSQGIHCSLRMGLIALASNTCNPSTQSVLDYLRSIDQMSAYSASRPLSCQLIRRIHYYIKRRDRIATSDLGRYRNRQNWIGPKQGTIEDAYFYPPKAQVVPKYMENLQRYLQRTDVDPLVQIALVMAQILMVHPFMDGNGRVGRALIPLFLWKRDLLSHPLFFMSAYFERHRLTYFRMLNGISSDKNWDAWIEFFLQGVIEEGALLCARVRSYLALYQALCLQCAQDPLRDVWLPFLFAHPICAAQAFPAPAVLPHLLARGTLHKGHNDRLCFLPLLRKSR